MSSCRYWTAVALFAAAPALAQEPLPSRLDTVQRNGKLHLAKAGGEYNTVVARWLK